ncbi:MAG: outer membrane beta-barrel protein [Phaeodactylibacter sp.]|nr:outer membrane beta-barrel protein [Phaeodactylibacter sp.]
MKQSFFTLLMACISLSAFAQEFHPQWFLGGGLQFSIRNLDSSSPLIGGPFFSTSDQSTQQTTFSITPYIGREINPYFALGLQAQLSYAKATGFSSIIFSSNGTADIIQQESTMKDYGGNLFARFNLMPFNALHFFLQPALGFFYNQRSTVAENIQSPSINNSSGYALSAALSPGLGYHINERWRILASMTGIRYQFGKNNGRNSFTFATTTSDLDVLFNLSSLFFALEFKF